MSVDEMLVHRRNQVVCPGVGQMSDMTAASASGATIVNADGKAFIDFAGGIGVMNVGHCDPVVVEAIREQAGKLLHACIHVATYARYVELCEKLVSLFPHGPATKAMLVNSGAEAVENAIKIARQATGRSSVICFTGAFHGRTLLATTLTSKINYKLGCGPFAPGVYRLPFPIVRTRDGDDENQISERELNRLRNTLRDTVAARDLAAIIIELVQGEGGFHVVPKPYLHGLRKICDEFGIVLIIDEVQTGFARTGRWAAYQHYDVIPDLSTWAKSLGGGLPISGVVGKAEIMDKVTPGTLGGTYGGNPLACAAALATIRRIDELNLNARATAQGVLIRERFESIAQQVQCVTDVRGLGAMMAIELANPDDHRRPGTDLVKSVIHGCRQDGLLIIPAGLDSNVIRVLAPLVISDADLGKGLDILERHISAQTSRITITN